jgi:hypothetical protein
MSPIDDRTRQPVLEQAVRDYTRLLGVLVVIALVAATLVGRGPLTTVCGVLLVIGGVGLLVIEWAVYS